MMKKNAFINGIHVRLDPIEEKDIKKIAEYISKWVNDPIVTYYMFTGQRPKNVAEIIQGLKKELDSNQNVIFLVSDKKTRQMIGYAGLYDINPSVRKAEFRILIGEKDFWGKGYGTEISEVVTLYGFDRLNLNRIYLGYTSANQGAKKAYERAGYVYEGMRRDDLYRNSTYYDSVIMALLRDDYYKKLYTIHHEKYKNQ